MGRLEMRFGWPRCARAERPLQMLATVGLKAKFGCLLDVPRQAADYY
jgi:hypothetical protein